MPFIKLQLGCLLIIAYIEIAYIRDISNADFRQIAYEVARFHHEKYNGSGSDFDPNIVRIFLDAKREVIALMRAHPEQAE